MKSGLLKSVLLENYTFGVFLVSLIKSFFLLFDFNKTNFGDILEQKSAGARCAGAPRGVIGGATAKGSARRSQRKNGGTWQEGCRTRRHESAIGRCCGKRARIHDVPWFWMSSLKSMKSWPWDYSSQLYKNHSSALFGALQTRPWSYSDLLL